MGDGLGMEDQDELKGQQRAHPETLNHEVARPELGTWIRWARQGRLAIFGFGTCWMENGRSAKDLFCPYLELGRRLTKDQTKKD